MKDETGFMRAIEEAFKQALRNQIMKEKSIPNGSKNILIENIGNISATLQNSPSFEDLISGDEISFNFEGKIDFTITFENGTITKNNNSFSVIGAKGKFIGNDKKIVFVEKVTIRLKNYL